MLTQYPAVRLAIYVVGVVLTAVGVGVAAYTAGAGLGGSILAGAGSLTSAALAVAASNTPPKPAGALSSAGPVRIDGDTWGDGTPVATTPVIGN